jgi:guanylate kinase
MEYPGTLVLIIGASGSGKGALLKRTKLLHPEIVFPLSSTTRKPRPNESHGQTYEFLSPEEFQAHIDAGDFLEWAMIDGNRYGTRISEVQRALEAGKLAIKEMDVQGIRLAEQVLPRKNIVTVYIDAGPWEVLEQRITGRSPMPVEELASRKARFEYELQYMHEADHIVKNYDGKLDEADAAFEAIIQKYLKSA